jgi:hypothetical protein
LMVAGGATLIFGVALLAVSGLSESKIGAPLVKGASTVVAAGKIVRPRAPRGGGRPAGTSPTRRGSASERGQKTYSAQDAYDYNADEDF